MEATAIAFPNLGIYLKYVPKIIPIGSFSIAIYGIMLATGILMGFIFGAWSAKDRGLDPDLIWDFTVPAVFFSICGARFYYVATSWDLYKNDPLSVFNLRQGGIAIYGAVIAAFITMYVYTRIKKIEYFKFADTVIGGLLIGQIIGRWGNFFNREAFGGYSDGLFAMRLPIAAVRTGDISEEIAAHITSEVNYIQVHPTFLYEGMWNLALFILMFMYRKHKKFEGELFFIYIVGYGIGRFFIESIRTDQLFIPGTNLPISMVVSSVSAILSLVVILYGRRKFPSAEYMISSGAEAVENGTKTSEEA